MSVDYPGAIDMMLPDSYTFNSVAPLKIVDHCTGGDMDLTSLHNTFVATMRSTHFGIDRLGNVAQFVPLVRGAGGNCCPDKDMQGNLLCSAFWIPLVQQYGNLNLCTISIEHCNDINNSLPLTPAQQLASNKLNLWLCQRYGLTTLDIHSHASINPINKASCPGSAFSFTQMFNYINANMNNGGTNKFMNQQFNTLWFNPDNEFPVDPSYQSGVYHIVLGGFLAGKYSACYQTSKEVPNVDWSGNAITWVGLSNGLHVEYANGKASVFDAFNHAVYQGSL